MAAGGGAGLEMARALPHLTRSGSLHTQRLQRGTGPRRLCRAYTLLRHLAARI